MARKTSAALAVLPFLWAGAAAAQASSNAGAANPQAPQFDRPAMHQSMCAEHYAHAVGHLAYLGARLNLTSQQRSAWDSWQQARTDAAAKEREACLAATPKGDSRPTALEHEAEAEKRLTAKLQGLQASRSSLQTLYAALSPEQRQIFDQSFGRHHGHGHWHGYGQGQGWGAGWEGSPQGAPAKP